MSQSIPCTRCRAEKPALGRAPMPGALGRRILAEICVDCWGEWQTMEVMVINELRLNFMDPESQVVLAKHLREFLGLAEESTG